MKILYDVRAKTHYKKSLFCQYEEKYELIKIRYVKNGKAKDDIKE